VLVGGILLSGGSLATPSGAATSGSEATICTWGGTPAAPTGTFVFSHGLTNTPSADPIHATATGELAGSAGCAGTVTFQGDFDPGATCNSFMIRGTVAGLAGVARFEGGGGVLSADVLYDKDGNVVGSDQPQVATEANLLHATDCNTAKGFKSGTFSSTIELYGGAQ
jgi:hypothetical protein